MKKPSRKQDGFTILELLIATMVFSVVLLLVTYGIIRIGNRYYKASLDAQTQAAARDIVDEVSRNIQFSGPPGVTPRPAAPGGNGAYCNNGVKYAYKQNVQQGSGGINHIFVVMDADPGCATPPDSLFTDPGLPSGARDMLSDGMRIAEFTVANVKTGVYSIKLRIVSGQDDMLCSPGKNDCSDATTSTNLNQQDLKCKLQEGSQFCAVSNLSTVVTQRLAN